MLGPYTLPSQCLSTKYVVSCDKWNVRPLNIHNRIKCHLLISIVPAQNPLFTNIDYCKPIYSTLDISTMIFLGPMTRGYPMVLSHGCIAQGISKLISNGLVTSFLGFYSYLYSSGAYPARNGMFALNMDNTIKCHLLISIVPAQN